MSRYAEFKKKSLKDKEIKKYYDEFEPEYNIIQAMIDTRKNQNITQKELSEITGIRQA